jgi:hypothetical protein
VGVCERPPALGPPRGPPQDSTHPTKMFRTTGRRSRRPRAGPSSRRGNSGVPGRVPRARPRTEDYDRGASPSPRTLLDNSTIASRRPRPWGGERPGAHSRPRGASVRYLRSIATTRRRIQAVTAHVGAEDAPRRPRRSRPSEDPAPNESNCQSGQAVASLPKRRSVPETRARQAAPADRRVAPLACPRPRRFVAGACYQTNPAPRKCLEIRTLRYKSRRIAGARMHSRLRHTVPAPHGLVERGMPGTKRTRRAATRGGVRSWGATGPVGPRRSGPPNRAIEVLDSEPPDRG